MTTHDVATAFDVAVWSFLTGITGVVLFRVVRFARATPEQREVLRLARRVRHGWAHLTVNVGLSYTDDTTRYRYDREGRRLPPVTRRPTIRVRRTTHGVDVDAGTLPGVGLAEYTKAAPYLADAWGCTAVQVRQTVPGTVRLRALLTDPLLGDLAFTGPSDTVRLDALRLGVDEYGQDAAIPIPETSGVTVGGLPGYGKTSLVGHGFVQLAPSPLVQFAILDGKGGGDYDDIARRAFLVCGDDLGEANKSLRRLYDLMSSRQRLIKSARGAANFWHSGPDERWPLVVVIVDESHTFVQQRRDTNLKKLAEENAWYLEQLTKKGRSVGFMTWLVTQKQTGDAIPTSIRDVCQVGITFACRTVEAAVAALGDDIRQYPDANPVRLIGREYVGVAVASLPGRPGYTRIRTPYVPDDVVAATAADTARLMRDPADLLARVSSRRLHAS